MCRQDLQFCQLNQGTVVSTQQKVMASLSSASTIADTAAKRKLGQEQADTQVPVCRVALGPIPMGMAAVIRGLGVALR